jgi:hypothetical protein
MGNKSLAWSLWGTFMIQTVNTERHSM